MLNQLIGLIVLCLTVTAAGCVAGDVAAPQSSGPATTLRGDFDVYYDLQVTETSGLGTGESPEKIKAIHFYREYLVLEIKPKGGRLIPIRQIKHLRWE